MTYFYARPLTETPLCRALRRKLLCYFLKRNYVTNVLVMQLSHTQELILSPGYTPTRPHTCTCARACVCARSHTNTYLVLLQGSLFLHVRTVFASDNSFDISHRHCREDRSEFTTTTTTTTSSSSSWQLCYSIWVLVLFFFSFFLQVIKTLNFPQICHCARPTRKTDVNTVCKKPTVSVGDCCSSLNSARHTFLQEINIKCW